MMDGYRCSRIRMTTPRARLTGMAPEGKKRQAA
jgi:hypothetical protein